MVRKGGTREGCRRQGEAGVCACASNRALGRGLQPEGQCIIPPVLLTTSQYYSCCILTELLPFRRCLRWWARCEAVLGFFVLLPWSALTRSLPSCMISRTDLRREGPPPDEPVVAAVAAVAVVAAGIVAVNDEVLSESLTKLHDTTGFVAKLSAVNAASYTPSSMDTSSTPAVL